MGAKIMDPYLHISILSQYDVYLYVHLLLSPLVSIKSIHVWNVRYEQFLALVLP